MSQNKKKKPQYNTVQRNATQVITRSNMQQIYVKMDD